MRAALLATALLAACGRPAPVAPPPAAPTEAAPTAQVAEPAPTDPPPAAAPATAPATDPAPAAAPPTAPATDPAPAAPVAAEEPAPAPPLRIRTADEAVSHVLTQIRAVPEIHAFEKRLEADHASLIAMIEGDVDTPTTGAPSYDIYVGENHPDHTVRLWSFHVDARTGAITSTDPATLEEHTFTEWREYVKTGGL